MFRLPFIFLFTVLSIFTSNFFAKDYQLDQKIGQMIIVGFKGYKIDDEPKLVEQIKKGMIGGVILSDFDTASQTYERNIKNSSQLKRLCQSIQSLAKIPLFICIDHEGGVVCRLKQKNGFPSTMSQQSLGEIDQLSFTYQYSEFAAKVLKNHGINLNLAPVVDVNRNKNCPCIGKKQRSFSSDPLKVHDHAKEMICAYKDVNVLTCIKHFPGHGSSNNDTHLGFVDVTNTWSKFELIPYKKLIDEDLVDIVMSAHVTNCAIDLDFPSSLSKNTVSGVLRDYLRYEGVVMTDDLQMKSLTDFFSLKDAIKYAIQAGNDLLLFANHETYDIEIAPKVIHYVKQLILEGEITELQINHSNERIQKLKLRLQESN
ncbi:Beta-hexosaminidase A precursor [Candidatus Rubidus massiliensis]|nr:Beta-hexosaminidase A precursor [Candidatus Rubidus massiliensis]